MEVLSIYLLGGAIIMDGFFSEYSGIVILSTPLLLLNLTIIIAYLMSVKRHNYNKKIRIVLSNPFVQIFFPIGLILFSIIDYRCNINILPYFAVIWIIGNIVIRIIQKAKKRKEQF